jgi:uncharacterized protein YyaL (SSP411 family)
LDLALALSEVLLARFADPGEGGFFFTSDDHERLIHRPKPLEDESVPSGNGVAARVLQRIGYLVGEPRYLEAARGTLAVSTEHMSRVPYAHASLLSALEEHLSGLETIVIRGARNELAHWTKIAARFYAPSRLILGIPSGEGGLPGALATMRPGGPTRMYRCIGTRCEPPIEDAAALEAVLTSSPG